MISNIMSIVRSVMKYDFIVSSLILFPMNLFNLLGWLFTFYPKIKETYQVQTNPFVQIGRYYLKYKFVVKVSKFDYILSKTMQKKIQVPNQRDLIFALLVY